MKTMQLNFELRNLGRRTHIWFPLAPADQDTAKIVISPVPHKIITENIWRNAIAYYLISQQQFSIKARYPVSIYSASLHAKILPAYTSSNSYVNSADESIKEIARSLTDACNSDEDRVKKCFDWVVNYLEYANPIGGLYSSVQALADRRVDCGGFSTLLVALIRSLSIPARCMMGWAVRSKHGYHAWVEYFDSAASRWVPLDPSAAHLGQRTKLDAGFGYIRDERVAVSVGEDLLLTGEKIRWRAPLLQIPVVVSLDISGIPIPVDEQLRWKVI